MKIIANTLLAVITTTFCFADTLIVDDDGKDYPKPDYYTIQDAVDASSDGDQILVYPGTYVPTSGLRGDGGCPTGEIPDCNGNCAPEEWIGDGYCDDGAFSWNDVPIFFNCDDFNCDDGDCNDCDSSNGQSQTVDTKGKAIHILSAAGPESTIITGYTFTNAIRCDSGESRDTIIEGFLITGGFATYGGGIYIEDSAPTIKNCKFEYNFAKDMGGAILAVGVVLEDGEYIGPKIINCEFQNNESLSWGGAVMGHTTSMILIGCSFESNFSAEYGGAVGLYTELEDKTFEHEIVECDFNENESGINGGALWSYNQPLEVRECTFINNYSSNNGGGVAESWGDSSYHDCTFSDNEALNSGGGMYLSETAAELTQCDFISNSIGSCNYWEVAVSGGGLIALGGIISIDTCNFDSNCASWAGGGAHFFGCDAVTATNCILEDNESFFGGAVSALGYWAEWNPTGEDVQCTVDFDSCVFDSNEASSGGAIEIAIMTQAYFNDCTMMNNINPDADSVQEIIYIGYESNAYFSGNNALQSIYAAEHETGKASIYFDLSPESSTTIDGDLTPSIDGANYFALDDSSSSSIDLTGTYNRQGSLAITNWSESLLDSEEGDIYEIIQAGSLTGEFKSIVFPLMPEGLGLELVESSSNQMVLEVVAEPGADLSNQFFESLDSLPVDLVAFDADGDGTEEIAVLYEGSPGAVVCFQMTADSAPMPINGFTAMVGNNPIGLDAGDIDGDGLDDLVIANQDDDTITVLISDIDSNGSSYFNASTINVPGNNQMLTCVAIFNHDGRDDDDDKTDLDAVVGVDKFDESTKDFYQVLRNIGSNSSSIGPSYEIDLIDPDDDGPSGYIPDSPTAVDGTVNGFVGGTQYGRVIHVSSRTGALDLLANIGINNIVTVTSVELNDDGSDYEPDILVTSNQAQVLYILEADPEENDGFGDLIPLAVDMPVEDVVALDADNDGDIDLIFTSPSTNSPLTILLNGGDPEDRGIKLGGRTWQRNEGNSATSPARITSGGLSPKDDEDDWVGGGSQSSGNLVGNSSTLEQMTFVFDLECEGDFDNDSIVGVEDLLSLIAAWGSCTNCEEDLNSDGIVGVEDLLTVIATWGPCE